ncbi:MAG: hypothetical protein AAFZ65_09495 [Planctomycetota bacterium]
MIRPLDPSRPATDRADGAPAPAFLTLDVEGAAPDRDALRAARLGRLNDEGEFEVVESQQLEHTKATLADLDAGALVVVAERHASAGWMHALGVGRERWLGLDELSAWVDPGGLGADLERLASAGREGARSLRSLEPDALRRATAGVVGRALALPELALGGIARAWELAALTLDELDEVAARRLRLLARLLDRPSTLGAPTRLDGRFRDCGERVPGLDLAVASAPGDWSGRASISAMVASSLCTTRAAAIDSSSSLSRDMKLVTLSMRAMDC